LSATAGKIRQETVFWPAAMDGNERQWSATAGKIRHETVFWPTAMVGNERQYSAMAGNSRHKRVFAGPIEAVRHETDRNSGRRQQSGVMGFRHQWR
jgi:hypothetical protein